LTFPAIHLAGSCRTRKNDRFKKVEELGVVGGNCAVSVEHGQGDAHHVFKRLAIGLEARGGSHAMNRYHEEVSQRLWVMRALRGSSGMATASTKRR
jgi:hypothetical protein